MNPLLFTDSAFLFFFAPIALTGYWIVPARWRNGFLLIASLLLYAWGEGRYIGILAASIAINWLAGIAISSASAFRSRKVALIIGIASNLMLLAVFKYATFVILNLDLLLVRTSFHRIEPPGYRLPIGLSFYTFMGISYLIDLYRRDLDKPSSLSRVALFMTMFPHLMIHHGRAVCIANRPKCAECAIEKLCHAADKSWSTVDIHKNAQP